MLHTVAERTLLSCLHSENSSLSSASWHDIRVVVLECGEYELQVLFRSIDKGAITSETHLLQVLGNVANSSPFKFCPGLGLKSYQEGVIRYDSKAIKLIHEPFARAESPQCQLWHKLAKNASIFEKALPDILCQPCKRANSYLERQLL